MTAPKQILELVDRFERNQEAYRSGQYKEAQLRREFIDPFFKALGWDVDNEQGYAEAYKDIVHEDTIKVGGATKAPDYCFRIGGTRKFFVEAKKPSVDIRYDVHPAYQLRRYAWSAKLPLSILIDFEEFAVYDCRIKPVKTDKASVARVLYLTYTEYADRWEDITSIFSREEVLKGSFDRYAESTKRKKGTVEVDTVFLKEIESWRENLARNIRLRNPKLTQRELNFAVQRTIDRIIFLRICEDRGIEDYGRLMVLQDGARVYRRLREIFFRADDRYNSGLFHFRKEKGRPEPPDELTPLLNIDDKPLKKIVKSLYYPESPYEFSVLPADILGQVYEQFLGKVIRLTPAHRAVVEDKPEVKKAGGVYYTPTYIVEYIVKHTVGKLLEGKTPRQAAKLRILDPACGSGSFLISAYQYFLDWHRDQYVDDDPKKHRKHLYQGPNGDWRLATAERKRILLNNIYGVDIDPQAVEVTKLSLLLKVLEGESEQTLATQLRLFHERALPDLASNIKCGNSLIGPDFYDNQQMNFFDDEERYRINVFDWNAEFPQIMRGGGFDVVIGNPPWGAYFGTEERSYLVNRHSVVPTKTKDSYLYFIRKAIDLVAERGFLGFIVPNTWLLINNARDFRRGLLSLDVRDIVDHGDGVFRQATVESATIVLVKRKAIDVPCRAVRVRKGAVLVDHLVDKRVWLDDDYCRILVDIDETQQKLFKKLGNASNPFESLCSVIWGIKPYQVGYGTPPQTREMVDKRVYHASRKKCKDWKPLLVGSDVDRYRLSFPGDRFIKYGRWLMYPSDEALMLQPKILLRQTSHILRAYYDGDGYYCQNSLFIIHSAEIHLKFLLGLLNSKVLNFVYRLRNPQSGKVFAEIKPSVIKQLPIYRVNRGNKTDKARHDRMVRLVDRMLQLHKKLAVAKTEHGKTVLQRQIAATDRQIDRLVYDLYRLTEEEIKIVEEAART